VSSHRAARLSSAAGSSPDNVPRASRSDALPSSQPPAIHNGRSKLAASPAAHSGTAAVGYGVISRLNAAKFRRACCARSHARSRPMPAAISASAAPAGSIRSRGMPRPGPGSAPPTGTMRRCPFLTARWKATTSSKSGIRSRGDGEPTRSLNDSGVDAITVFADRTSRRGSGSLWMVAATKASASSCEGPTTATDGVADSSHWRRLAAACARPARMKTVDSGGAVTRDQSVQYVSTSTAPSGASLVRASTTDGRLACTRAIHRGRPHR
jgi:hypothetical protein